MSVSLTKPPVRILIILFHVYGLLVTCLSDTSMRKSLSSYSIWGFVILLAFFVPTLYFYISVCKGPGFVELNPEINREGSGYYCSKCNIHPPVRSGHCKECQRCVLRRDHHCPWMGTCIGMNNHFHFLLYLFFEGVTLFIFAYNCIPAALIDKDLTEWIFTSFQCAIVSGLSVLGMVQPIVLFPTHLFFAIVNKTTWETTRRDRISYFQNWSYSHSPFSQGLTGNIKEFVTMKNLQPVYQIPTSDSIQEWKTKNKFIFNENYELC